MVFSILIKNNLKETEEKCYENCHSSNIAIAFHLSPLQKFIVFPGYTYLLDGDRLARSV